MTNISFLSLALVALTQIKPTKNRAIMDKVISSHFKDCEELDLSHLDILLVIDKKQDKQRATTEASSTMAFLREYITSKTKNHFPKNLSIVKQVSKQTHEF